ncbi:MAG: hypothetical protein FJX73_06175 [Armatimonadetes bacterium]|nr:hypothetical protein [Armatimonadota bacterium]
MDAEPQDGGPRDDLLYLWMAGRGFRLTHASLVSAVWGAVLPAVVRPGNRSAARSVGQEESKAEEDPMSTQLDEATRAFLGEPNPAVLATVSPEGRPQATPVWFTLEGDQILINTSKGRVKLRNLKA